MRGIIPVGLHRSGVRSYREGRQVETADMLSRPIPASMPQSSLMDERPGFRDYWAARTRAGDPAAAPPSIRAEEQTWFTPAQKLWGAGLVTGIGGIVDARGKYPVPPGDEATVPEMLRSERMPGMVEHYKTGHPVIGTLQGLGLLPLVGYAKAASGPVRTALAATRTGSRVAAKTPAPTGIAAIPMTRRKFLEKAGIAGAGIAALGAGIGRATKGAKTKAAAAAGRVGAKVGQLTHRADIHKFHDWIVGGYGRAAEPRSLPAGLVAGDKVEWRTVGSQRRSTNPLAPNARTLAGSKGYPEGVHLMPEESVNWLKNYGLDPSDYHIISNERGGADAARVRNIESSPETIVDSFVANGNKTNLHEIHGVPVVEVPGIWSYVPNEVGLQKLELHQMKQVMGDDFLEIMHTYPNYANLYPGFIRDRYRPSFPGAPPERVGPFYGPGHHLAEISDRSPVWPVVENYLDIPLAK